MRQQKQLNTLSSTPKGDLKFFLSRTSYSKVPQEFVSSSLHSNLSPKSWEDHGQMLQDSLKNENSALPKKKNRKKLILDEELYTNRRDNFNLERPNEKLLRSQLMSINADKLNVKDLITKASAQTPQISSSTSRGNKQNPALNGGSFLPEINAKRKNSLSQHLRNKTDSESAEQNSISENQTNIIVRQSGTGIQALSLENLSLGQNGISQINLTQISSQAKGALGGKWPEGEIYSNSIESFSKGGKELGTSAEGENTRNGVYIELPNRVTRSRMGANTYTKSFYNSDGKKDYYDKVGYDVSHMLEPKRQNIRRHENSMSVLERLANTSNGFHRSPENMSAFFMRAPRSKIEFSSDYQEVIEELNKLEFFFSPAGASDSIQYSPSIRPAHIIETNNSKTNIVERIKQVVSPSHNMNDSKEEADVREAFMKNIKENLKREHPNLLSNTPAGRIEAVILRNWLLKTLKQVYENEEIEKKYKFGIADDIFNLCFGEMIRQVSVTVNERGEFLMFIWESYIRLFQRFLEFDRQEMVKRIHEKEVIHKEDIRKLKEKIEGHKKVEREHESVLSKLQQELATLKVSIMNYVFKEKTLNQQITKYSAVNDKLADKIRGLKREKDLWQRKFTKVKGKLDEKLQQENLQFWEDNDDEQDQNNKSEVINDINEFLEEEARRDNADDRNGEDVMIRNQVDGLEKIMLSKATEIDWEHNRSYNSYAYIQTDLVLIDKRFDDFLISNNAIEDNMQEFNLKKEIMGFDDNEKPSNFRKSGLDLDRLSVYQERSSPIERSPTHKKSNRLSTVSPEERSRGGSINNRKSILTYLEQVSRPFKKRSIIDEEKNVTEIKEENDVEEGTEVKHITKEKFSTALKKTFGIDLEGVILSKPKEEAQTVKNVEPGEMNEQKYKHPEKKIEIAKSSKTESSSFNEALQKLDTSNSRNTAATNNQVPDKKIEGNEQSDDSKSVNLKNIDNWEQNIELNKIANTKNGTFEVKKAEMPIVEEHHNESDWSNKEINESKGKNSNKYLNLDEDTVLEKSKVFTEDPINKPKTPENDKKPVELGLNLKEVPSISKQERTTSRSSSSSSISGASSIQNIHSITNIQEPNVRKNTKLTKKTSIEIALFDNKLTDRSIQDKISLNDVENVDKNIEIPTFNIKLNSVPNFLESANESPGPDNEGENQTKAFKDLENINEEATGNKGINDQKRKTFLSNNSLAEPGDASKQSSGNSRIAKLTTQSSFKHAAAKRRSSMRVEVSARFTESQESKIIQAVNLMKRGSLLESKKKFSEGIPEEEENELFSPIRKFKQSEKQDAHEEKVKYSLDKLQKFVLNSDLKSSNLMKKKTGVVAENPPGSFSNIPPSKFVRSQQHKTSRLIPNQPNNLDPVRRMTTMAVTTKNLSPQRDVPNSKEGSRENSLMLDQEGVDEEDEIRQHFSELIMMLKVESSKNENYRKKNDLLYSLLGELVNFTKQLFLEVLPYFKANNPRLLEELTLQFNDIRSRIPRELDTAYESDIYHKQELTSSQKLFKRTLTVQKVLFAVPKLKGDKNAMQDKLNHPGILLVAKLREKQIAKNVKNSLPLRNVMKLITLMYDEKIALAKETPQIKEQEMPIFVFNHFLNKYGFKKVAEQKFTVFALGLKQHSHILRANLFARFINVLAPSLNYNVDETKKYIEGMEFLLYGSTMGTSIPHSEGDLKRFVPYIRAVDYLKNFSDGKMTQEEMLEMKKEIETFKENDPKNINKYGIIDIDLFLSRIISQFRLILRRTSEFVIQAFKSADLDGNKMCNLKEFLMLYRHIEKKKFNENDATDLFDLQADLVSEDEKNMSFDRFTAVCVDYGLFSQAQQNLFLNISTESELANKFSELRLKWSERKSELQNNLDNVKDYIEAEEYENWEKILDVLEKRIQKSDEIDKKPLLIAYKIMNAELLRLFETKQDLGLVPEENEEEEAKEKILEKEEEVQDSKEVSMNEIGEETLMEK